jgi:hypothetical protein
MNVLYAIRRPARSRTFHPLRLRIVHLPHATIKGSPDRQPPPSRSVQLLRRAPPPTCPSTSARHVAGRTPLERPTRFELVANLKTGNALGVTMPQSILLSAAELFQRCLVCALIAGFA